MSRLVTRYEDDLSLLPDRWHKVGVAFLAVFGVALPFLADAHWLGVANDALIAIVGAVALMILTGFSGQVSLGHAAFLAWGAYTAAIMGQELQTPFWLNMLAAGFVSAAVGLLIGPIALRLRGLYLAIVTLGLLFMTHHVLNAFPDLTGGPAGIATPMYTGFGGDPADTLGDFWDESSLFGVAVVFEQKLYFVFALVAVLVTLMAKNLARTRSGRAMMAVRDHDLAAAVLGVNTASTKVIAFTISAFIAGVAGAMYAFKAWQITVSPPFDLGMSVTFIAMIVLGGIGTTFGAVWGAVAFVVLEPLARLVAGGLPFMEALTTNQQSNLVFALVVIGFLLFEPLGLVGIWLRVKRYFMAWPFRY